MHRIFIAVKVTPDTLFTREINFLKNALVNESIKWIELSNIHVTLAFLGDTEDLKIISIGEMLYAKCTKPAPFDFTIKGLGLFKNIADPKILWAGLENIIELENLQAIIINGLKETGIRIGERKFTPHITLGRIRNLKKKELVSNLVKEYSGHEFQKVHISEVILYESILTQTGSVYKPLVVVPLIGK
jgi:RNA 2',3'-cyclic 3'-phosphodiesterase